MLGMSGLSGISGIQVYMFFYLSGCLIILPNHVRAHVSLSVSTTTKAFGHVYHYGWFAMYLLLLFIEIHIFNL